MSSKKKQQASLDDAFEHAMLGSGSVSLRAGLALGMWALLDGIRPKKHRAPRGLIKLTELLVVEIGRQAKVVRDVEVPDDELTAAAAMRVLARHQRMKR